MSLTKLKPSTSDIAYDIIYDKATEVISYIQALLIKFSNFTNEDLAQDIYLYLLENTKERYNNNYCLTTFIGGITRQLYLNSLRGKRLKDVSTEDLDESVYKSTEVDERLNSVLEFLEQENDPRTIAIIRGYFLEGLTLEQVARLPSVGVSPEWVRRLRNEWISKARSQIGCLSA